MTLTRREMLALTGAACLPAGRAAEAAPDPTRIFTGGDKPNDARLGKPKTLNDLFPFTLPNDLASWKERRQRIREQVQVATGLWPMPDRCDLKTVIHGRVDKGDYTVEKVFFASLPGHYVTGNLYRPKWDVRKGRQKHPAVLFAHGHWSNGRFHDAGEKAAEASVKAGAEADLARGRFFMQAIPATLAGMGFVVFQYDMVGYADSAAIPHILKSGVPHPDGFADADGELRLQSLMGLQTWNSVRCVDFLETLLDVDPKRIAVTGASGGGTQTFLLAALDDRIQAAFPAVMVSTAMQGGCVCENCSLLRVGTGNVELAALFAPKPLAMSAANDWTKDLMTKGYPELQRLYALHGEKAERKVLAKAWLGFGHNYNQHAREMMYEWFREHLQGARGPVIEPDYEPIPPADLSVFDKDHPRPKDELAAKELRKAMAVASDAQMARLTPKDADSLDEFQRVMRVALRAMLCDEMPERAVDRREPEEVELPGRAVYRKGDKAIELFGHMKSIKSVIGRDGERDAVPLCELYPPNLFTHGHVVVWLHPQGKASLYKGDEPRAEARTLFEHGYAVVAPDLLGSGELAFEKVFAVNEVYAGFTYGYNRSLLAQRVHDVLTVFAHLSRRVGLASVSVVGWEEFGPVAALATAAAQGGWKLRKVAADLNQFRFENVTKTDDPMMLPGAVKYGGLPAFLAMCAPTEVLAHNHRGTATGRLPKAAYEAAAASGKLVREEAKLEAAKVVEWLVK